MGYDPGDSTPRYVPPGSCTWCGHPPHKVTCKATIRVTTKGATGPCPCAKEVIHVAGEVPLPV